jgi:hypothetical protein
MAGIAASARLRLPCFSDIEEAFAALGERMRGKGKYGVRAVI